MVAAVASKPKAKDPLWVGFDLGGTKMLAKVFDSRFSEASSVRRRTKGQETASGLARVVDAIREALAEAGAEPKAVAAIGIGSPGPLDLDRGMLLDMPNFGWRNLPLKRRIAKAFGRPVLVVNDVDAGVYAEYRAGAARGARCVLGVFPGTGIGGGCVMDGRIVRGKTLSCLEIGHMTVVPDGPLCGCGKRGCLEAVAGRLAIAAEAAVAAHRGKAPHLLDDAGTDISRIRSGALARSIRAGDQAVEDIVRHAAGWIGRAVGNTVNLLAPDVVVLGGGLVESLPPWFVAEIEKGARATAMRTFEDSFRVVRASLGDDAVAFGAALLAREMVRAGEGG